MLRRCRNELICDFAETYRIYDLGSLSVFTMAILADGLRDNSRTKMKLTGAKVAPDLFLLAHIADRLGLLLWKDTKDAKKNRNRPASFVNLILGIEDETKTKTKVDSFDTFEEFEEARKKIIERVLNNGRT